MIKKIAQINDTVFFEKGDDFIISFDKDTYEINRYDVAARGSDAFDYTVFNEALYWIDTGHSEIGRITPGDPDLEFLGSRMGFPSDLQVYSDGLLIIGTTYTVSEEDTIFKVNRLTTDDIVYDILTLYPDWSIFMV